MTLLADAWSMKQSCPLLNLCQIKKIKGGLIDLSAKPQVKISTNNNNKRTHRPRKEPQQRQNTIRKDRHLQIVSVAAAEMMAAAAEWTMSDSAKTAPCLLGGR